MLPMSPVCFVNYVTSLYQATAETAEKVTEATAETTEKVTGTTADTVEKAAEATVEEVSGQKAEPEKKEAESVH